MKNFPTANPGPLKLGDWAKPVTTHSRHNRSVTEYFSRKDDNGKAVYSFSRDFQDTWDQETENQHEAKNSDPWLRIEELEAKLEALQEELNDFHWAQDVRSNRVAEYC
jgi:hypothetical protein